MPSAQQLRQAREDLRLKTLHVIDSDGVSRFHFEINYGIRDDQPAKWFVGIVGTTDWINPDPATNGYKLGGKHYGGYDSYEAAEQALRSYRTMMFSQVVESEIRSLSTLLPKPPEG